VEGVAEPDEPSGLQGRGDVEHPRKDRRLIRHDADAESAEVGEAAEDVRRVLALYLIELAVVDYTTDHVTHVVRLVGVVGHDVEQRVVPSVTRVRAAAARR